MVRIELKKTDNHSFTQLPEDNDYLSSRITNWRMNIKSNVWQPPTDMYETEELITIVIEIAGVDKNDLSLIYNKDTLVISGIRLASTVRRIFHQMEIRYGEFESQIKLPCSIDAKNIEAFYQNGFLVVQLLKAIPKQMNVNKE